ncbi:peptide-methionine (S)-S-oxide reductase [Thiocapsa imhoffii]|uniref:Peptide methionine sulfoxide reductase MsrA n=1 Tax=Thiocapsa imhoffii TaxID=382777 RepID=A0A9X0WFS7_9GAMM|nr:peptide-methionine (S)-S-oxide reductase MsrA [Thiocapsa imhoffii]MBK1643793.1 peptide-methionine (S)-S-oxide reductase [Thiocapsa imhoffii]
MATESATLGGGCFWCLEAAFQGLRGVESVVSGYAGGDAKQANYYAVCTGTTGHAEVVQVAFDPERIDFATLLRVFFTIHDPTTPDRQGADIGPQYRSVIFYHDEVQRQVAERVIAELERSAVWSAPIVTQIQPLETFHAAESSHQDYYRRNPSQGYCQVVIAPKLARVRARHAELLDETP